MSVTMSLAGTFDGNDFAEVVELLSRRACTGRFVVRAASLNATIHLSDGSAVAVDVVVAGGAWREGRKDLRGELEEVCLQAIRSSRGTFEFQPSESVESDVERGVRLPTVLAAAKRRLALWLEIEAVIPSMSSVLHLGETLRATKLTVDPEQWRAIASIDGRRTVGGMARRLGIEPLKLCQMLVPLIRDGALELGSSEVKPKVTPELTRLNVDPALMACGEEQAGEDAHSGVTVKGSADIPSFRVVPRSAKPLGPATAT